MVAAGTYVQCITLKAEVALYGGFAGGETDLSQRDWVANVTVLDGNRAGSVVTALSAAKNSTRIDGFTIRNGSGTVSGPSHIGGGIYCYYSSPTIANNTITGNSASTGGGIQCVNCNPVIANNTIAGNMASSSGGAMYWKDSGPGIVNTIINFNSSGIYRTGGTAPTLRYNCVYGNTAYNYSGLTDPTGTNGNISADPLFVAASPGANGIWGTADDTYGDLHLLPGSPCIDAGSNADVPADTADLDGDGNVTEPLPVDLGGGQPVPG